MNKNVSDVKILLSVFCGFIIIEFFVQCIRNCYMNGVLLNHKFVPISSKLMKNNVHSNFLLYNTTLFITSYFLNLVNRFEKFECT